MTDVPRYLARRSEVGYTNHMIAAMSDEPEAVSVAVQDEMTARMHRVVHESKRETWAATREELRRQSDFHAARVRACQREIRRLDRKLSA
jgi:hypothetical protein